MAVQVTPLPTPPTRQDPANFSARGDAFLGALPLFQTELNDVAFQVNNDADQAVQAAGDAALERAEAFTYKNAAELAASDAATSESNAADSELAAAISASNASDSELAADGFAQDSANSASLSDASRIASEDARDLAEYWAEQAQQTVEGGLIDDTSLLANRVRSALNDSIGNFENIDVSTSTSIDTLQFARITASGASVSVTLPAAPSEGQMFMVGNMTNRTDHQILVGSTPVKGQDAGGSIIIDRTFYTVTLKYVNATYGWEII